MHVVAVEGSDIEKQLDFKPQQDGEIGQAEQEAARARYGSFGGGHGAVVADTDAYFGLAVGEGGLGQRLAGGVLGAEKHPAHHLPDGGGNGLVQLLRQKRVEPHLHAVGKIVEEGGRLLHPVLPVLEFGVGLLFFGSHGEANEFGAKLGEHKCWPAR